MSEAKPKRKFWQIHLSTAVVLMFAAAILLRLNVDNRFFYSDSGSGFAQYGFPIPIYGEDYQQYAPIQMQLVLLLADAGIGVFVLKGVAEICEWLIRRREDRKT